MNRGTHSFCSRGSLVRVYGPEANGAAVENLGDGVGRRVVVKEILSHLLFL